jgi:glutamate N-acetyltransferase/amino-acid N-acetyltransferase
MAALLADELLLQPTDVLVGSTGRIGLPLPMPNIRAGIREIVKELDDAPSAAHHAAEAIMTSDTRPKEIAVEFKLAGKTVRLGGIGKGAGMIQPGMSPTGARPASMPLHATMLAYLTTDAKVDARTLRTCLREAVATSFNCITIDGDMSTNDTVLLLANGLAGNKKLSARDLKIFQAALNHVCLELAKMMVRDGEGITRMVTVRVKGAKSAADAEAAARAVGNSTLVKTSWHGGDPNWGRIIDALGYSPAKVIEEKVDIAYSKPGASGAKALVHSLKKGRPTKATFKTLCTAVAPAEFDLHINLNLGKSAATLYAADLTEEYVDYNKGDITNPASLGG